jgi:hypothetical protein
MYSTQGSITIKRLRNGDNLFLSFATNGKPLFQSIDPEDFSKIYPDFNIKDNQPEITPKADTSMTPNVPLLNHRWEYDYVPIEWNESVEETGNYAGYYLSKNFLVGENVNAPQFALKKSTGGIRVINNLVNDESVRNSTLTYKGEAVIQGIRYSVSKTVEFILQPMGANTYNAFVTVKGGEDAVLGDKIGEDSLVLTTMLYYSKGTLDNYTVKWYKDNEVWKDVDDNDIVGKEVTVTRDDVGGTQLFIANFYLTDGKSGEIKGGEIASAGIVIADIKDEYGIRFTTGTGHVPETDPPQYYSDMVAPNSPVLLIAHVYNAKTNSDVTLQGAKWEIDVLDSSTFDSVLNLGTEIVDGEERPKRWKHNSITLTTEHTDYEYKDEQGNVLGMKVRDLLVLAEVEFEGVINPTQ